MLCRFACSRQARIQSQRGRLLTVLLALTLPLAAVAFVFALRTASEAEARSHAEQLNLARAVAATTAAFVDGNAQSGQSLSSTFRDATEPSDELDQRLLDAVTLNRAWRSAVVIASDGSVIGSSIPTFVGTSLADREYFQHVTSSGTPFVSDVLSSRLGGSLIVVLAVTLQFDDGTNGAFAVELNRDHLRTELLPELQLDSSRVVLLDGNGQLVFDSRLAPRGVDGGLAASARWAVVNDEAAGTVEIVLEGEENLLAFAPVGPTGWVTTVSEPSDVALAQARSYTKQRTVVLGVSLVLILSLAWITGGWLNRSYAALEVARLEAEQARERAEKAAAARDEFLSIASHELRNPAAGIRGLAQLLRRRARPDSLTVEIKRDYVEQLFNSSERLARLVDDLLDVSRLTGGRLTLQLETVNLAELVESARSRAPLGDHLVTIERSDEPVRVSVDPLRIEQVIWNLLENAAKYSPPASPIKVVVGTDETHGMAQVRVTDIGIGIPPDELEGLFQPFKRASNAARGHFPGMGLGLYVSRGLVEQHGGVLWAESSGEGQGSSFILTLPTESAD